MKYMGNKNRVAKSILPIILKDRGIDQYYVEPFVGGANVIDKVGGPRLGADSDKYIIALLNHLQAGWIPPMELSEEKYQHVKNNKNMYPDYFVGYVGIVLSYGSKWFGGYMRGKDNRGVDRDFRKEGFRNVMRQVNSLTGIDFVCCDYMDLSIPDKSIIYCDPPYQNVTKYKDSIDHGLFFQWCRDQKANGHTVFVSEYVAPTDFKCVWKKTVSSSLTLKTSKKSIEKLFTI